MFVCLSIGIYNNPNFPMKDGCNIRLYSMLREAYFNETNTFFKTITWVGKQTQVNGYILYPNCDQVQSQ